MSAPVVSVVMACHQSGPWVAEAVDSVLVQTLKALELIVVDDGSTDDGPERVLARARRDSRVRLIRRERAEGPAAARNAALAEARGRWIAVVDSDDLIHPDRLRRLVETAEACGADVICDDVLSFDDAGIAPPELFLKGPLAKGPAWVEAAAYVRSNGLFGREPALGYLKPLIRAGALRERGMVYDPRLRIAEDFDLVARLLLTGARMRCICDPLYFYRRRGGSISHRLSPAPIAAMREAQTALRTLAGDRADVVAALDARERSLRRAETFCRLIDALKARRPGLALRLAAGDPGAAALLRLPLAARLKRLVPRRKAVPPRGAKDLVVLSRQRVVGATNGSSAYLLSIVESLKARGWSPRFVGPSPAAFGRWPAMRLKPETRAFDAVTLRGAWKLGPWLVAKNPTIAARAALTAAERVMAKLKIRPAGWVKPAPYAIAVPTTREDALFVARHARGAGAVLCDYAFLTELAPYVLNPAARTAVVMHDLFSAREALFAKAGASDSVARLTAEEEMRMLAQGGAVFAIQSEEAAIVAAALPETPVIVAPMAAAPVARAAPGEGASLLFVGSNTAPNVDALSWFFAEVWPRVRAERPHATLDVAGTVGRAVGAAPEGARLLGLVDDLDALYARAAVVVSPLRTGSGLKIKLIEAMSRGKAIVATPVTAQGVETLMPGAVEIEEEAAAFARAVVDLLDDPERRRVLGEASLDVIRRRFSAEACYRGVARWFEGAGAVNDPTETPSEAEADVRA